MLSAAQEKRFGSVPLAALSVTEEARGLNLTPLGPTHV